MTNIPEPPMSEDDTKPSIAVRPEGLDERIQQQQSQRTSSGSWLGWASLLAAAAFTAATLVLLVLPTGEVDPPPQQNGESTQSVALATTATPAPTTAATTVPVEPTVDRQAAQADGVAPVVGAGDLFNLLRQPVETTGDARLSRVDYNPFTIINADRSRTEFVDYEVVQGDTIDAIANRYGLQRESLAWCNDRRIAQVVRPGDIVRVPPADGACHTVLGTREETINEIAAQYEVDDPYRIIDSPYNPDLFGRNPDEILPGGIRLFIPGGVGPAITWNPGYDTETDEAGNLTRVSFARGQSGSCGQVQATGSVLWGTPLGASSGTWIRGFYAGHTGIDIAAPTGTPIYAANSGNVLFSGTSAWGYGNAVVLEHGPFSTLYGHMSSIAVRCGQYVNVGQVVGYVGNTGQSTGPHLHFEIRFNDEATDPTTYPIGW